MSSQDGINSSPHDSLSVEREDVGIAAPSETAEAFDEHTEIGSSDEAAVENAFVGDVADDAADDEVNLEWDDDAADDAALDESSFVTRLSLSDEPEADRAVSDDDPQGDAHVRHGRTDILVCHSGPERALEQQGVERFDTRESTSVPSDRQECLSSEYALDPQPTAEAEEHAIIEAAAVPSIEPLPAAGPSHSLRSTAHHLQTAADDLRQVDAQDASAEETASADETTDALREAESAVEGLIGDEVQSAGAVDAPVTASDAVQPEPFWQAWMPRPGWLRRSNAEAPAMVEESASAYTETTEQFDDAPPAAAETTLTGEEVPFEEAAVNDPVAAAEADGESFVTAYGAAEHEHFAVDSVDEAEVDAEEFDGAFPDAPYNGYSEGHPDSIDEEDEAEAAVVGSTGGGWSIPLLCIGIAVIACCVIIPQADVNRRLSYERQSLRQDLDSVQAQVATNDEFLRKLAADPQLAERLAQRQLKLMRPGDKLLPIAQGNAGTSPFELVQIAPPNQLPPYQPIGGEIATLCYNPRTRLYLMGGGLFLMAAALVLSIETVPSQRRLLPSESIDPEA